jgi:hypothetical protein
VGLAQHAYCGGHKLDSVVDEAVAPLRQEPCWHTGEACAFRSADSVDLADNGVDGCASLGAGANAVGYIPCKQFDHFEPP